MAYRNYDTAVSHIVDTTGQGDFTTIAAALTAASSGQTIFIRPGTYSENPTLKAGVNLVAYIADAQTPNVVINGKCTMTTAGTVTISGIQLQTNSDFCLAVTGSAASIVNLINCYVNGLNNTAISYTSSSGSSQISCYRCNGNLGTTGIAYFSASGAGNLFFYHGIFANSGGSTTASTISAGDVTIFDTEFLNPITTSSTAGAGFYYTYFGITNTTALTCGGSGGHNADFCDFNTGTASSISVGNNLTLTHATVNSSNTNAITGSGTLTYGSVVFDGSSSTINTTTQTPIPWPVKQGGTGISSATAYAVICGGTTSTAALQSIAGVGTTGQVLTSNGAGALPTFQNVSATGAFDTINVQVFTSSGTYTPTSGMKYCIIECVGSGGGGGGTANTGAGVFGGGGGGGGGGYARLFASAATIGSSQTVTVGSAGTAGSAGNNAGGNGGDVSVGSLCIGKGGTGGAGGNGTIASNGGAGGVAGTGTFTSPGGPGQACLFATNATANTFSSAGGNSYFGYGAPLTYTGATATGVAGSLYGGGGGGGVSSNAGGTAAGGAGGKGVVIITEYIS